MSKPLTAAEEAHYEDLLGKGPGDPDMHGYPGEPKEEITPNEYDPTDIPF